MDGGEDAALSKKTGQFGIGQITEIMALFSFVKRAVQSKWLLQRTTCETPTS